MKFIQRDLGDAEEVNSGGGAGGLRKEIVSLVLLTAGAVTLIYFVVFWITELAVLRIPPEKEHKFFSIADTVSGSTSVPDHLNEKFALCEAVLEKLQSSEGVLPIQYSLVYLEDLKPNALAIPGGKIAVTRGLLNSLDEEIVIAFVIAHELGHFAQRDHLRGLGRQLGFGVCLQILFGGEVDSFTRGATNLAMAK